MYPIATINTLFVVASAILYMTLFTRLQKHRNMRKIAVLIGILSGEYSYLFLINHVYILTDDNQVQELGLIKISNFKRVNGTAIALIPEYKLYKSW